MHFAQFLFVSLVLTLSGARAFAGATEKPDLSSYKFEVRECPDGEKRDGARDSFPKSLGSIRGWKIDIVDQHPDPSGVWSDWIVIRVTRPDGGQKICQNVSLSTIAEAGKPKLKIENDLLVVLETLHDRYSPDSWETTTSYRLEENGALEISSHTLVQPFEEFKKKFESSLKGNDLDVLLALRNKYVSTLANSYNGGFFNDERRSLCFRSLEVATKIATKNVAVSKPTFTRFFAELGDDDTSQYKCAKAYNPPATRAVPTEHEDERETEDNENATDQLTEKCDSSAWQDCNPLVAKEILILNNAAFLLQKMGLHKEALVLLRIVLKHDPERKVAYKNLGDSLAAQKKSGSALAFLAPDLLKHNRKTLPKIEIQSIAKRTGATCGAAETLTAKTFLNSANFFEFEFRCKPTGTNTNAGRLRARWDAALDDVMVIKTLAEKKASDRCPVSKIEKTKQLTTWTAPENYSGKLPGLASQFAKPCENVVGYRQFGDCKWLIACRGGLNRPEETLNRFWGTITDVVVADEYDESVRKVSRTSSSISRFSPVEKGVQIDESVRIEPDKTHRDSQFVKLGSFNIICDAEGCAESNYRCDESEPLRSLALELRPVAAAQGSEPMFQKQDVKLTKFFSFKSDAPTFEPGQLMSRHGYFDNGFSEELWDVGLMRRRRLNCDRGSK